MTFQPFFPTDSHLQQPFPALNLFHPVFEHVHGERRCLASLNKN